MPFDSQTSLCPMERPAALTRLSKSRLRGAKQSYVTRRLPLKNKYFLRSDDVSLEAGDVVLARVVSTGQHRRIELPTGRRANLFAEDEILVACGSRYAADQFEAHSPTELGPCALVAGGGIAAVPTSRHAKMRSATKIDLTAVICDETGRKINLRDFAIKAPEQSLQVKPHVIVVVGASMNAGKTTTAASIIHGMQKAKLRPAACKITGTGAGCDAWKYIDAGAVSVLDFTDAGHATTAGVAIAELEEAAETLIAASSRGADVVIAEIADGILQSETAALLQSGKFRALVDSIVFAAGDPLAAATGVERLRALGYEPAFVSGLITASPIATREAQAITTAPIVTAEFLTTDPDMPAIALHPASIPRIGGHVATA